MVYIGVMMSLFVRVFERISAPLYTHLYAHSLGMMDENILAPRLPPCG